MCTPHSDVNQTGTRVGPTRIWTRVRWYILRSKPPCHPNSSFTEKSTTPWPVIHSHAARPEFQAAGNSVQPGNVAPESEAYLVVAYLISSKAFLAFLSSSLISSSSFTREYFFGSLRMRKMMSSTAMRPGRPTSIAFFVWNTVEWDDTYTEMLHDLI